MIDGWLLVAPVAVPLAAAAVAFFAVGRRDVHRTLAIVTPASTSVLAAILLVRVARDGIQVVQASGWAAPFGISFVADHLSAALTLVASLTATMVALYATREIDATRESLGYHPVALVLLAGVHGAFLTGDLFNLYVWFEVLLISSFVLLTLGNAREQLVGGMKYVAVNLIASLTFLVAVGLLYGATGSLNMADLAVTVRALPAGVATTLAMAFLVAFGIKSATFPLLFWLPAAYPTPPAPVMALFAALLTKVGAYAMIRVFTLIFTSDVAWTHGILTALAIVTMLVGAAGAVAHDDLRTILVYTIPASIGATLLGLGAFTEAALAAATFYLLHDVVVKADLFMLAGIVRSVTGTHDTREMGGLYRHRAWLATAFLVAGLSLVGVPPSSGFWAKVAIAFATVDDGLWWGLVAILVVGGALLYAFGRVWQRAFWAPRPVESLRSVRVPWTTWLPVAVLTTATVALGVGAGPVLDLAHTAAFELMHPNVYVEAVLGEEAALLVAAR